MSEVKIFKQYEIPVINPEDSPFVKTGDSYYAKGAIQSLNYSPNSSTGWKLGENGDGSSIPTSYLYGSIDLDNLNIASQGWTSTLTFSSTDYNTVAWTSGTITTASGTSYSIGAGNTGNMSNPTYIYLDVATSTTALQITTTASSSVGAGKILICVANNVSDTSKDAEFQAFGGKGGISKLITADVIAAGTITADEIATNTITAGKMNVSTLSSIAADIGTITAGSITGVTITGGTIQTSSSSNTGVKMTSSGFVAYGEVVSFYNTSGNLRGYLGASTSEFYMVGVTNQNVKIGSFQDIYLDAAAGFSVTPARSNVDLGNSNYFWRNVHANKYTFDNISYYLTRSSGALVFTGMNRLTMDGGTFRRVGFTYQQGGNSFYLEVLATGNPVQV